MRFLASFLFLASSVHAFMPNPDLLTIFPPVASAGSTVEVRIQGTNLDEATTLRFADERFLVEPVTLPADEFHSEARPVEGRFRITIPTEVEPGLYEVRSLGYFGLSTARPFQVVAAEEEVRREEGDHSTVETALPLTMENSVLGLTDNQKIDWYRFSAKAGKRILVDVWAERLDSKADCQLALYDATGRELESNQDHFGQDPMIDFTPPEDGDYFLALSDALYRGSAQSFYRLKVSQAPLVDFAFPPAIEPGKTAKVTLFGRNLPGGKRQAAVETLEVEVSAPKDPTLLPGIRTSTPRQGMIPAFRTDSPLPFQLGFATAPVTIEAPEAEVLVVTLPTEIAGRFDEPGDTDRFRFSAQEGETISLEVISERLGAVTDPLISVHQITTDDAGQETRAAVAENDDPPSFYGIDALDDLNADTRDPALSFIAKTAGTYEVTLINQRAGGSLAHLYRLAIRAPQPDFQLIAGTERTKTINNDAYPAAPLLRRGGAIVYRILALRQDGFEGDIVVEASGLPKGVIAPPLVMSGTTREGYLTLQASPDAAAWSGPIRITGSTKIGDQEVNREARNGSIIWGTRVFGNQRQIRSRLDEEIVLSVIETEVEPATLAPAEEKIWTVEMNQTLEIPFLVTDVGQRKGSLQVEVFGFPGILRSPPSTSVAEGKSTGSLSISFKPSGNFQIAPGKYQFVLQGVGNAIYRQNPEAVTRAEAEIARLDQLAQEKEGAEADLKTIAQLKTAAEKVLQAANTTAKEKTWQFATYSLPITVEVTAPAPKS